MNEDVINFYGKWLNTDYSIENDCRFHMEIDDWVQFAKDFALSKIPKCKKCGAPMSLFEDRFFLCTANEHGENLSEVVKEIFPTQKDEISEDEWHWMMNFCKTQQIPAAQPWSWDKAKKALRKHILENEENVKRDLNEMRKMSAPEPKCPYCGCNKIHKLFNISFCQNKICLKKWNNEKIKK